MFLCWNWSGVDVTVRKGPSHRFYDTLFTRLSFVRRIDCLTMQVQDCQWATLMGILKQQTKASVAESVTNDAIPNEFDMADRFITLDVFADNHV